MDRRFAKYRLLLLPILFFFTSPVLAEDWPRTLPVKQGSITVYSPQVDEFDGKNIEFRAALAYRETADAEPVFGAGWFESLVDSAPSGSAIRPEDLQLTDVRFPDGAGVDRAELSSALRLGALIGRFDFSPEEIQASMDRTGAETAALDQLNTEPPLIIYRDRPALLVSLDGEPVIREIENSPYQAVINTPYPMITDGSRYYLNVARDVWYSAPKATGPYRFEDSPPAGIAALVDEQESGADQAGTNVTAQNAPEIVVSTEPAELLVSEGPAAFVPLVDDLLVLQNSDDDVFMHVTSQKFYIVLAGRWYESESLDGPWNYRPSDELPGAFANIPEDSGQADSRVYVAGTEEAFESVREAQVPQTAAVARGEADIDVQYDGDPSFEDVDGADMTYASNTGSTVILANGMYYLVEDGVWYISSTPNGPWLVSDHRPPQVVSIQPTSPVYNVRYVYVYDSTPDVVYVGYTPGYLGSYVHHNTLFYGSGWYYRPWVSPYYYYPRHATWGFNVSYNYWSGWSFGLSWGWGPFSFGWYSGGYWHHHHHWHHRHYRRWGPGRYRPRPYYRGRHGHRPRGRHYAHRNLYRDGRQRARVAGTRDVAQRRVDQKGREYNKHAYRKAKYGKSGPVKAQSIRSKAAVRDASARASRKRLIAEYNDKARRQPSKEARKQDAIRRKSPVTASGGKSLVTSNTLKSNKKRSSTSRFAKQSTVRDKASVRGLSKQQNIKAHSKPQVVKRQSKSRVVRQQSKPQAIKAQAIKAQNRPQVAKRQSKPQVVQRHKLKSDGRMRTKSAAPRQRSRKN